MPTADDAPPPGLVYYPDSRPGIRRKRHGRGFTYLAADGTRIDCARERARLKALAVPPAYEDVWMSPLANGHLQATGRDARRRKQYRYHPDWTKARSDGKFDQLATFGATLPALRRWIADRLTGEVGDLETAVAAVLALIDRGALRVGDPGYTADNGSFGATTLRNRQVRFDGTRVHLDFVAKGGKRVHQTVVGAQLQRVLQRSRDLPGSELVTWLADDGTPRIVRSEHLGDVLARICGDGTTAKSLRTWHGTHAAFMAATKPEPLTIRIMSEAAAERLNNTPSIARTSYIHPAIIALAELSDDERATRLDALGDDTRDGLRRGEAALLACLREAA